MNKRIALFLPSLRGGGAERVMVDLAKGFSEKGYTVDLILAKAEGPYLSELTSSIRVIDLAQPRVAFTLLGLIKYLRKEKPMAMLATLNHVNVIAVLATKLSGTATRVIVRQANTLSTNSGGRLISVLVRFFYPFADKIVAVSSGVADDLVATARVNRKTIEVIYNPIVNEALYKKANESIDHPWFKAGGPPVVLSAGRLNAIKDFATLIAAVKLTKQIRPLRLMILGEGNCRKELETMIVSNKLEDDVLLPGFISNPFPFFKHCNLFVLSSISEGLPNALIQSLALGVPVVSTDCPNGPNEILESGRWGKLVPIKKPQLMSEAILSTLENSDNKQEDAKSSCKERFGVDSIVLKYIKIIMDQS